MFRLSTLFRRRAQLAPPNPVIDPAARSGAATAAVPGGTRDARAGRGGTGPTARALELAATLEARGVAIPVLTSRFPHVVDRIASAWSDPARLAAVFEDLLFDDRGGRQGFPADAAEELFAVHRAGRGGPTGTDATPAAARPPAAGPAPDRAAPADGPR